MTVEMVICPNCEGWPSFHWPGGACTICKGRGKTDEATAKRIRHGLDDGDDQTPAGEAEVGPSVRVVVSV